MFQSSVGTIFSLRSRRRDDSYLSLEVSGTDLKLIHVGTNGTDVVRIPTTLEDGKWHQITISIHDDSIVDTYIDCEWSRTDILKKDSFDIPEDSDLIIGYLFTLMVNPFGYRVEYPDIRECPRDKFSVIRLPGHCDMETALGPLCDRLPRSPMISCHHVVS
ncbi:Laminin G domain [Popillia japonica]|uniref:Laminin G domain n=1 Tax=Popillia japonica TaxID=7064 RepID=A0AAW1IAS0_POPJA